MTAPTPTPNPLSILPLSWMNRIPELRGTWAWLSWSLGWAAWVGAAYLTYKEPGALGVLGAGLIMTSYAIANKLK